MRPPCPSSHRRPLAPTLLLAVGAIAGFTHISPANAECSVDPWADAVVESTWTTTSPDFVDLAVSDWVEAFELWVSPDGVDWVLPGVTRPVNPFGGEAEPLGFDLLGSGVETVTRVRVVHLTVDTQNRHEGVDLDVVGADGFEPPTSCSQGGTKRTWGRARVHTVGGTS